MTAISVAPVPRGGASAPQNLSPRFGAPQWRRRFHPLSSEFQGSRSAHLVEALRVTEVLCPSGQEADLQGVFGPLVDATREPFLDQEGLGNHQNRPICRYLSPLPDSNRGPPPYHALQTASGRNPRQQFWLVFAASAPIRFATGCHWLQPWGSIRAPSFVIS
jgi:hypothetical protein